MENKLSQFIQHAIASQPISGTSLISSLYGDALHHRGGEVWLGSLTKLLEPMGFTDRFVRTSVFRLQKEGWLDVEKIGRRSYYRISERGQSRFRRAENKIYLAGQPDWDGKWDLLLLEAADKDEKIRLKKELSWLGFGQFNTSLMAAPSCAQSDVPTLLNELNATENAIYFHADYPYSRSEKTSKNWFHTLGLCKKFQSITISLFPYLGHLHYSLKKILTHRFPLNTVFSYVCY